jgi:hypothetical protein
MKKNIIFICSLVIVVSLLISGYSINDNIKTENNISFDKFIKSDVIENNSKIIDEDKGVETIVYMGEYGGKNGVFITLASDNSIFSNEYLFVEAAEIYLIFPDGKQEKCYSEIIDNRIVYISDINKYYNIEQCKIEYNLKLHLYVDGEETGKLTMQKSNIETFTPTTVVLFDDVSYIVDSILLENNTSKNQYDIKVNISPDNNLAGLSSIGQAVYIGCDGEEKKLTDTGDGIYSGIITNNFEELSIRLTVANFYANCSGEFSIGSN